MAESVIQHLTTSTVKSELRAPTRRRNRRGVRASVPRHMSARPIPVSRPNRKSRTSKTTSFARRKDDTGVTQGTPEAQSEPAASTQQQSLPVVEGHTLRFGQRDIDDFLLTALNSPRDAREAIEDFIVSRQGAGREKFPRDRKVFNRKEMAKLESLPVSPAIKKQHTELLYEMKIAAEVEFEIEAITASSQLALQSLRQRRVQVEANFRELWRL